jgi:AcrR family transcriptional regulator
MEAVMACISEFGLERTTMRTVAERAGVSPGTLMYYFRSKKALVDTALFDASQRYMERFRTLIDREDREPSTLKKLVERFWNHDNTDAAFVVQIIEVGLHNAALRGTHQEMVAAGRALIEDSIKAGIEIGHYRDDIDPKLAAALLHSVLIWWGSELVWNATSEDMAREVSLFAARLLEKNDSFNRDNLGSADASTKETIRALLIRDPSLDRRTAMSLADSIDSMYGIAVDASTVDSSDTLR